jgi:1,4-dihydroxy-2-naphthoate octaprenyltransferase
LAVSALRSLYDSEGCELNSVLAATGKLMTIHGLLLSAGLLFN